MFGLILLSGVFAGGLYVGVLGAACLRPSKADHARRVADAHRILDRSTSTRSARSIHPPPAPISILPPLPPELAGLTGVSLVELSRHCSTVEIRTAPDGSITYLSASFSAPCPLEKIVAARVRGELTVTQARRSLASTRSVDNALGYESGGPSGGVGG